MLLGDLGVDAVVLLSQVGHKLLEVVPLLRGDLEPLPDAKVKDLRRAYRAAMSYTDDNVGKVLGALKEMADRVGIIRGGKILMVDEKSAMMARLGRTEAIVTLAKPRDALPPAIARFPVELQEDGRTICYRGGDGTGKGREEVAELTKALIGEGIDYVGLDVRESSLEDIFVSLLGEEEEQAA